MSKLSTDQQTGNTTAAQSAIQHQAGGLAHPLDDKHSTVGIHTVVVLRDLTEAFKHPLGYGLGSTTMGTKLGDSSEGYGSSDFDFSDAFLSLGPIGGLLYILFIVLVGRRLIRFVRTRPSVTAFPILGILSATLTVWVAQGQYGLFPLIWLLIGYVSQEPGTSQHESTPAQRYAPQAAAF